LGKAHVTCAPGAHGERKMLKRGSKNPITDRSVRGETGGENQKLPKAEFAHRQKSAREKSVDRNATDPKGPKIAQAGQKKNSHPTATSKGHGSA